MTHIAIYPGTFDPVTRGHIDIITRAASITDQLIVSVAADGGKTAMFTLDERVNMVKHHINDIRNKNESLKAEITVVPFSGLLMHFAEKQQAKMIIRGLRAITDFDYEFQMTGMNRRLNPNIETVFLMASETNQFISSRMVKEIARLGGDISSFVPAQVKDALTEKLN